MGTHLNYLAATIPISITKWQIYHLEPKYMYFVFKYKGNKFFQQKK